MVRKLNKFKDNISIENRIAESLNKEFGDSNILSEKTNFKIIPKWSMSTFLHVLTGSLPITNAIYDDMTKPIRGTCYHTTDPEGLEYLLKTQKQKKTLSVSSHIAYGTGLHRSGVVAKLEADILLGETHDIMSRPDDSGRRWVQPSNLIMDPDILNMFEDFQYDMEKAHEKSLLKLIDDANKPLSDVNKKTMVNQYVTGIIGIVGDHNLTNYWGSKHMKTANFGDPNYLGFRDKQMKHSLDDLPTESQKIIKKGFYNIVKDYFDRVKILYTKAVNAIKGKLGKIINRERHYDAFNELLANNYVVKMAILKYDSVNMVIKMKDKQDEFIKLSKKYGNIDYGVRLRDRNNADYYTLESWADKENKSSPSKKFELKFEKTDYINW